MNDLAIKPNEFEAEIDTKILEYLGRSGSGDLNLVDVEEKRLIIKELALCNKKTEIVPKLNAIRRDKGLPELRKDFDIYYYQKQYSELIEAISLEYAKNLAKKYRFANRIVRVAKLNEIAEAVLDRIQFRDGKEDLKEKEEKLHNENIKVFAQLINTIDEQMGKLKITNIDLNIRNEAARPVIANAGDVQQLITEAIKKYSNQLPSSVDANFVDFTDYAKCEYAQELPGGKHLCWYFKENCHVQEGKMNVCPHFLNKPLLANKEHITNLYQNKNLSVKDLAEIAGCKQVDEKSVIHVREWLKKHGIWRKPAGGADGDDGSAELPDIPVGKVAD